MEKYQQIKKDYSLCVNGVTFGMIDELRPQIVSGDSLTYTLNNGVVSFIDENGIGYVTPFCGIIQTLKQAGYQEGKLYVPFSDNEILNNNVYGQRWNNLLSASRYYSMNGKTFATGEVLDFNIEESYENSRTL